MATFCGQLIQNLSLGVSNPGTNPAPAVLYGILSPLTFVATLSTAFDTDPVIGYVAADTVNNIMYVVFRGTLTQQEWHKDFEFQQVVLPPVFGVAAAVAATILVHDGFLDLFELLQPALLTALQQYPTITRAVVTGHSLGAGIASLATCYMATALSMQVWMYGLAKPRVGNIAYSTYMQTLVPNSLYLLSNNDGNR